MLNFGQSVDTMLKQNHSEMYHVYGYFLLPHLVHLVYQLLNPI